MANERMMTGLEAHCAAAFLLWGDNGVGFVDFSEECVVSAAKLYLDHAERCGLDGDTRVPWSDEMEPFVAVGAWILYKRHDTQKPFEVAVWSGLKGLAYLSAYRIGEFSNDLFEGIRKNYNA